ncbi:5'-AMP-activated protein kinase catalytic subunit alpha-1-like [Impatiens glandulifera]|uniref:5'-AMP-activated protein kinase catalytic subunit alpha-1-like n=1 Tax=Impatiens glandulifera TaxID=253017 RepID=UPI001FB0B950|nr:5'-AMP-activated protein kinase catalytic subunit alpha-1-like [Impatiens glandulifera]
MDQLRQVGEALGSLKALTVFKDDIQINRRQCCFLLDMFTLAFEAVLDQIRQNLRPEEKNATRWKALENPLKELRNVFKEGELYVKNCLDFKDWWGRTISLHQSNDCVEFHVHNLLHCFAVLVEAIETASEMSFGKNDGEWNDPNLFRLKYGKQYLVPREVCRRLESVWREDQWCLMEIIKKQQKKQQLSALLLKKCEKLLPSSILTGANDYQVKRRLGSCCKEIQWLGESFAVKKYYGEIDESMEKEICNVVSLSHPNILQYHCGFCDQDKKENFLVMELMTKSLDSYIKENCGLRKRVPFSISSAVDVLLQIARGVEYLHSRKIYHGELKPSNILLKSTSEVSFRVKIKGFGLNSIKKHAYRKTSNENRDEDAIIWFAPEVIGDQDQEQFKYTEKADVYSFGMLCFEVLTGKIPFEEGHLQEDKKGRNICAGERPLFPFTTPRYLVNFTRKCWQADPVQRPSFPGICRILRYVKKNLLVNPESLPPLVDYYEIESGYSKLFPPNHESVSYVPFQMFAYRAVEKEKTPRTEGDVVVPDEDHLLGSADKTKMKSLLPPKPEKRRSPSSSSATADDQRSNGWETPERRDSPPLAAASEITEDEADHDHPKEKVLPSGDEIPKKTSLKKEINPKKNLLELSKGKALLKKKIILDAKANNNKSPGKISGYSSSESSSKRSSGNSPMLKPCKQCLRLNRECRKPSMMSSNKIGIPDSMIHSYVTNSRVVPARFYHLYAIAATIAASPWRCHKQTLSLHWTIDFSQIQEPELLTGFPSGWQLHLAIMVD